MLRSWWDLGEHVGTLGSELATYQIECAFCGEKGNYSTEHHAEKKKPNSSKVLNFDTLKCGSCGGYVLVLWSSMEHAGSQSLHSFRVIPYPLKITEAPEHWPPEIQRYWLQAQRSLEGDNWDAAAVMARSAMQIALREHKAQGKDLKAEIEDLATRGILPPLMKDWSHEVRELGNDSAHPKPGQQPTTSEDANDIVEFLDFMLEYLYNLPKQIADYRERRKSSK